MTILGSDGKPEYGKCTPKCGNQYYMKEEGLTCEKCDTECEKCSNNGAENCQMSNRGFLIDIDLITKKPVYIALNDTTLNMDDKYMEKGSGKIMSCVAPCKDCWTKDICKSCSKGFLEWESCVEKCSSNNTYMNPKTSACDPCPDNLIVCNSDGTPIIGSEEKCDAQCDGCWAGTPMYCRKCGKDANGNQLSTTFSEETSLMVCSASCKEGEFNYQGWCNSCPKGTTGCQFIEAGPLETITATSCDVDKTGMFLIQGHCKNEYVPGTYFDWQLGWYGFCDCNCEACDMKPNVCIKCRDELVVDPNTNRCVPDI
jgi:hypothetical protein